MPFSSAQQRVSDFWAESHWRNGFKASAPGAHSGHDIGGWPAGTMIPALRGGVVTHNFYDAYYGWCLSVQISKSTWDIYCHMKVQSPQKVDYSIEFGEGVGQVGNTGAFSAGNHLHLTISSSWKPAYRPTTNPKATINVALKRATTPAGGTGTPLPVDREEDEMAKASMIHHKVPTGTRRGVFVPGTGYFIEFVEGTSGAYANPLAISMETGNSVQVTESLFNAFKAAAEALRPVALVLPAAPGATAEPQIVTLTGTIQPQ